MSEDITDLQNDGRVIVRYFYNRLRQALTPRLCWRDTINPLVRFHYQQKHRCGATVLVDCHRFKYFDPRLQLTTTRNE